MILFPNCKLNIGLNILRKRSDNFHDLETVFYPLSLCDILEINYSILFNFSMSGIQIPDSGDNIVVKAYRLLQNEYNLPPVSIHLHKVVPIGAGLGGGSSDAAYTLSGLNNLFELGLGQKELLNYSLKLGSDCPFFILNNPCFAEGRGELLSETDVSLEGLKIVLIKPDCEVSTGMAYGGIKPKIPEISLKESIKLPVKEWKDKITNDFEESVFYKYPEIPEIKEKLYSFGAVYASMSGSGSSVFGLFKDIPERFDIHFPDCFYWDNSNK